MSFDFWCHWTFYVIGHFMSFVILCDLSDLSHHSNHLVTKVIMVLMLKVYVYWHKCSKSQKVACLRTVIGHYGCKSSFGGKNTVWRDFERREESVEQTLTLLGHWWKGHLNQVRERPMEDWHWISTALRPGDKNYSGNSGGMWWPTKQCSDKTFDQKRAPPTMM